MTAGILGLGLPPVVSGRRRPRRNSAGTPWRVANPVRVTLRAPRAGRAAHAADGPGRSLVSSTRGAGRCFPGTAEGRRASEPWRRSRGSSSRSQRHNRTFGMAAIAANLARTVTIIEFAGRTRDGTPGRALVNPVIENVLASLPDIQWPRGVPLTDIELQNVLADQEDGMRRTLDIHAADLDATHKRKRERHKVARLWVEASDECFPEPQLEAIDGLIVREIPQVVLQACGLPRVSHTNQQGAPLNRRAQYDRVLAVTAESDTSPDRGGPPHNRQSVRVSLQAVRRSAFSPDRG